MDGDVNIPMKDLLPMVHPNDIVFDGKCIKQGRTDCYVRRFTTPRLIIAFVQILTKVTNKYSQAGTFLE